MEQLDLSCQEVEVVAAPNDFTSGLALGVGIGGLVIAIT